MYRNYKDIDVYLYEFRDWNCSHCERRIGKHLYGDKQRRRVQADL